MSEEKTVAVIPTLSFCCCWFCRGPSHHDHRNYNLIFFFYIAIICSWLVVAVAALAAGGLASSVMDVISASLSWVLMEPGTKQKRGHDCRGNVCSSEPGMVADRREMDTTFFAFQPRHEDRDSRPFTTDPSTDPSTNPSTDPSTEPSLSSGGCVFPTVADDDRSVGGGGGGADLNPSPWSNKRINPAAVVVRLIFLAAIGHGAKNTHTTGRSAVAVTIDPASVHRDAAAAWNGSDRKSGRIVFGNTSVGQTRRSVK
jgi:hypothetical protein